METNFKAYFDSLLVNEGVPESFLETRSLTKNVDFSNLVRATSLEIFSFPENILSEKIGTHPDFEDADLPKNQFICSIFLDIKGSTILALKYPLDIVQKIKNAVLIFGIEVIKYFGGHIHRIQGDALFAFTGFQDFKKSDAIIQAITAGSVIQYFNEKYLKPYFEEELRVSPLKIRIGIDFGDDKEVLWDNYGIDGINEITVTSIHADLASKLQHKAKSNSIVLGYNAYNYLQIHSDLLDNVLDSKGNIEYYIIDRSDLNYRYGMKVFNWEKYLKRISHVSFDAIQLKCFANGKEYFTNCSLDKGIDLSYKLEASQFILEDIKEVKWTVFNSGEEAAKAGDLEHIQESVSKFLCETSTAYNGNHFMQCKISRNKGKDLTLWFTIFVNDDELSSNYLKKIELIGDKS